MVLAGQWCADGPRNAPRPSRATSQSEVRGHGARQSDGPWHTFDNKGEYADECFKSSNRNCILFGANRFGIFARRKGRRMEPKTMVTFSGPVEIPPVHVKGWGVLPAGTYVFRVLDSQSDRHIVQIFNQDETQCLATILAIPDFRLKPTSKTVITFRERPAGQPEALRAWFYPGQSWGAEFVYPKARAVEIAKDDQYARSLHAAMSRWKSRSRSCRQTSGGRATEAGPGHGDSTYG